MNKAQALLAAVCIAVLAACTNPLRPARGGEGTITIAFGSGRVALHPGEIAAMTHEITLTGPGGATITESITGPGTASFAVAPGNWDISVRGMDDFNADLFPDIMLWAFGETAEPVAVRAGESASAHIAMTSVIGVQTPEQLQASLSAWPDLDTNMPIRLMNDISLTGGGWTPIGYFTGVFDGGGYAISGLATNLFGTINGGTVRDLRLVDVNINIAGPVGALAMMNAAGSTVENVSVNGYVSGGAEVGGIVGRNGGTVRNVFVSGTVTGAANTVGGVVGQNLITGIVENSTVTAAVSGGGDSVGGVAGINTGTVENSFATGSVGGGNDNVGGVAGVNNGTVQNSFATGDVSGSNAVGGVVGINNNGTVQNSFSTGNVSGTAFVGGVVGDGATSTIRNNVALNPRIEGSNPFHRIAGRHSVGTIGNNHARGDMVFNPPDPPPISAAGGLDGEDITATEWHNAAWWPTAAPAGPGFSGTYWQFRPNALPILRNMPPEAQQNPAVR